MLILQLYFSLYTSLDNNSQSTKPLNFSNRIDSAVISVWTPFP